MLGRIIDEKLTKEELERLRDGDLGSCAWNAGAGDPGRGCFVQVLSGRLNWEDVALSRGIDDAPYRYDAIMMRLALGRRYINTGFPLFVTAEQLAPGLALLNRLIKA